MQEESNPNSIDSLTNMAKINVRDVLKHSILFDAAEGDVALVIYDKQNGLTDILTDAYRANLPDAKFIDFDTVSKEEIISEFERLNTADEKKDLVVLIQTSNFRLDDFRIRLHLFQKKLKVIEHMHLYRNSSETWDVYVNSLAYDVSWYRHVGPKLKEKLDSARNLKIKSSDANLFINSELESAKLNIGDYTGMENIGGTFPIGEVFTEAKSLESMNGEVYIYAYADKDFNISMHEPFKIKIENGIVISWAENTPESFIDIIKVISEYERPIIREIGFGLNRAITKERYLGDITAFERIYGMHFSLGEKHSVYKKEGIQTNKSKFHVDIFPIIDSVEIEEETIYKDGQYLV